MTIVILDIKTIGDVLNLDQLKEFGEFKSYPTTSSNLTAERVKDANVMISNKVVLNKDLIKSAKC